MRVMNKMTSAALIGKDATLQRDFKRIANQIHAVHVILCLY